ncbi:potassium channel family protein [Mangrovibacillus cuniculi]|uniref:Potassium channel family protein n=1 Tax=Mangrovibacillus cuniculi TaxID=2593652 RepID=A0A7S8HGQ2_9BACI|nr:potassium channel family protein [Mangrovibacillus cuniculi]QPC47811.1 potassium channel family protein [Mangrovibacillus cuniculi]
MTYESLMFILIITSVVLSFSEDPALQLFDNFVYGLLVIDFAVRFFKSPNKRKFIKQHPLEIIALIPFDALFKAARLARLFMIFRLFGLGSRFITPLFSILQTNGLGRILLLTCMMIFLIPIPILYFEPNISTYEDAIWWAIVTTTTVGYGDISPSSPVGRVLAVILMFLGIGIIGTFTSAVSGYFLQQPESKQEKVSDILKHIEKMDSLTDYEADFLQKAIDAKRFSSIEKNKEHIE